MRNISRVRYFHSTQKKEIIFFNWWMYYSLSILFCCIVLMNENSHLLSCVKSFSSVAKTFVTYKSLNQLILLKPLKIMWVNWVWENIHLLFPRLKHANVRRFSLSNERPQNIDEEYENLHEKIQKDRKLRKKKKKKFDVGLRISVLTCKIVGCVLTRIQVLFTNSSKYAKVHVKQIQSSNVQDRLNCNAYNE